MRNLTNGIQAYHIEYEKYPATDNATCVAALQGANPRKIQFIEVLPAKLDAKGRFLDPWGVPYEIAISPRREIVVTSAGPDRAFGSRDDVVEKR